MKKLPYILIFLFVITIGIEMVGLIIVQTNPSQAITFKPQVGLGIGQFKKCDSQAMSKEDYEKCGVNISGSTIGDYINEIYKYAISVVAIFATVMMMWGGLMWITAAGNASRVDNAKSYVTSAITGLVLALASYMVLYTINPDLTRFSSIDPTKGGKSVICCDKSNGKTFPPKVSTDIKNNKLVYTCPTNSETDICESNETCTKNGCVTELEQKNTVKTELKKACDGKSDGAPCAFQTLGPNSGYCYQGMCHQCGHCNSGPNASWQCCGSQQCVKHGIYYYCE